MKLRTAHVGRRGTIVIPASVRSRLGISEGSVVIIEDRDDSVVIRPARVVPADDTWREKLIREANEAYDALRKDAAAWREIEAEREAWDATLPDGLEDEPWDEESPGPAGR